MRKRKYLSYFLFGIIVVLAAISVTLTACKVIYPLRYEEYIEKYSEQYNLDKYLVMALIKAESNYIYDAHSGIARGLMQITDDTALWIAQSMKIDFKPDNIEDPETNIKMGCYYLRYLLDYYNQNTDLTLAAYNAGMGNVNKWLENSDISASDGSLHTIPFSETDKYLKKINRAKKIYKQLYE